MTNLQWAEPTSASVTKRLSLVTKATFLVVLIVMAMVVTEPITLLVALVVTIAVTLTSGISGRRLLSSLKPLLLVIFLLFLFTAFTYDPSNAVNQYARQQIAHIADIGPVTIQLTVGGIVFGIVFVLKILLMMFGSVYVVGSTAMEEILAGLNKLGAPAAIGLMAMIVFRFMPTMMDEVETIKEAQRARGAGASLSTDGNGKGRKTKAVQGTIPLFVPMIVSSMRRSDTLAMSMVSRGFGFVKHPTQLFDLKVTTLDAVIIAALVLLLAALLYSRFALGLGTL